MLLIIALYIVFSTISCQTEPPIINVQSIAFPVPIPPEKPNITFINTLEGLYLSHAEGRLLAKYLVSMEEHRKIIMEILEYYKK